MIRKIGKDILLLTVLTAITFTAFPNQVQAKESIKKLDLNTEILGEVNERELDSIVGKEFKPTKSQIDRMKKQNASYSPYEPDLLREEKPYDKMTDEEFNSIPFLLGNSKDFQIFFNAACDNLIVKTSDDKYVKVDIYFTIPSKDYAPEYAQYDFDGDGEDELIVKFMHSHGLGYTFINVLGLLVYDKGENGKWVAYHPLFDDIMKPFTDNIYAVKEGNNSASLYVNGKKTGPTIELDTTEKVNSMELSLDSGISYMPDGEDIYVIISPCILGINWDISSLPLVEFANNHCYMKMNYKGNGKFSYGPITTGQGGYAVFNDKLKELDLYRGYTFLEGPGVDTAILLMPKESFASSSWREQPKEIEGFVMEKGDLVSIGKVKSEYSTYGFRRTAGGLLYGNGHKYVKIVPDVKEKCWKVYESISEDGEYIDSKGRITNDLKKYDEMNSKYFAADILYLR